MGSAPSLPRCPAQRRPLAWPSAYGTERVALAEEEVDVGVVRGEVQPDSADLSGIRFLAGGWSAVVDTQHLNGARRAGPEGGT
ncbi:hypothetical protein Slala04_70030 [Streptomyces lavendulae subsp. lavendulae]|nr:hypothetical protein Slala04_70030 [Streptomyces lavendulae subsp. lavendulae]